MRRLEGNLTANKVSLALEALESLDAFMPTLERMPNLIDLDLHGNKLTKLPKDMSKLRKLRSLNLRHNNFPSVQGILPSLTTLPALRSLHVDSVTDAEEEAVIIGLPNMSVFNGTNLHGDENEHEHIYSRTMQERRDSRDEAALNKQVEEKHEKQEVYRFNETKPNITANDPVPPPISSSSSATDGASTISPSQFELPKSSFPNGVQVGDNESISASDITEVETLFNEIKNLRPSISRTEEARLRKIIEDHIQTTVSGLEKKVGETQDAFMKRRETTNAKAQLYDVCFEEAINYAITSGNPNFGVALRKLRLSQQSMLLEFGGLINAMHIHYIERLRNMSKQLKNAESENSMLLNAAEALEKEALQNNEEKARMMTQYEKVCLDNRQLNRMLEEANKRKGVSNDTNGYDFHGQPKAGYPRASTCTTSPRATNGARSTKPT